MAKLREQPKTHEEAINAIKTELDAAVAYPNEARKHGRTKTTTPRGRQQKGARASSGYTNGTAGGPAHTERSTQGAQPAQRGRKGDKRSTGGEEGAGHRKAARRSDDRPWKRGDGHRRHLKTGRVASATLTILAWVAQRKGAEEGYTRLKPEAAGGGADNQLKAGSGGNDMEEALGRRCNLHHQGRGCAGGHIWGTVPRRPAETGCRQSLGRGWLGGLWSWHSCRMHGWMHWAA